MRADLDAQIKAQIDAAKLRGERDDAVRVAIYNTLEMNAAQQADVLRLARDVACSEPPRTPSELWHAVRLIFGYKLPLTSTHPDFNAPFEWFSKVYFNQIEDSVALASRGGGKTLQASMLMTMASMWRPNYDAVHAGGTQVQAQVASAYLNSFYNKQWLKPAFATKPAKFSASWKNHSEWRIVTGSMKGVSGQHSNILTLDEIEFWEIEALTQTFEVPIHKNGYRRVWTAFSTRQRCLPAYTRVVTEDGPMKIGKIVNSKYNGKVRVWDAENQRWDWRKVVEWHRNGSSTEWYKVYTKHSGLGKGCELVATGDHHVYYAPDKKKPLREFTEKDCLVMPSWVPSRQQRQALLGTLLGDAHMQAGSVRIEHSVAQIDYVRWWAKAFCEHFLGETHNVQRDHYLVRLPACPYTNNLQEEWYSTGEKRVPDYVWDELDEFGLAVWLMDDGSYRKAGTKNGGDTWHIYCNMFNEHERTCVEQWFAKRGVDVSWQWNGTHFYAYIGGAGARKVNDMVAPYLTVSEHIGPRRGYKRWKGVDVASGSLSAVQVPIDRIEIEITKPQGCYDIGVEGIHNYTNGSGVLVSNSYGAMNWLVDEAPKRGFAFYQWSVFEMMQPCITCEAIDKEPYGDDNARECVCPLWNACKGVRAKKSTGWLPLEDARKKCIRLGGPRGREWQTQGLCNRPSSHGLVLHNFEHSYKPEGNYTKWTYVPELPWYAVHDPSEGKKSVIYFLQEYDGMTFMFDEIVDPLCPDVTKAKQDFYDHCLRMGYPDPAVIVVDPHRTDAVATWKVGSKSGTGIMHKYEADVPDISESSGVTQLLNKTLELLRQAICDGSGVRRLFINPDYCPCAVRGVKEYHYPTDPVTNEIISDTPDKSYSDEVDPMRYWQMYKITKLGKTAGRVIVM